MKISGSTYSLSVVCGVALVVSLLAAGPGFAETPTVSTLYPNAATVGGPSFTLVVNGSGFDSSSVVQWRGQARPTSLVRNTQLKATIAAFDIAIVSAVAVTVVNSGPAGGTSNAFSFAVTISAVPSIVGLLPASANAGGAPFVLTVSGIGFAAGSFVQWNGSDRATAYLSSSTLETGISRADIASAGVVDVAVRAPGGVTSNIVPFSVFTIAGPPAITSLVPDSIAAGSASFTLTVRGIRYTQTSAILWNGTPRATTYLDDTTLRTTVAAEEIAVPADVSVTVQETAPGGAVSNKATFSIQPFSTLYFAQLAVGGGYTTTITLTNNGNEPATGLLTLTDQSGKPFSVNVTEGSTTAPATPGDGNTQAVGSSVSVSVPAGVTATYGLSSVNVGEPTKSAWAKVQVSRGSLGGVATFRVKQGTVLQSIAGVLSSSAFDAVTIPVENDAGAQRYAGFALANPSGDDVYVRIALVNTAGAVVESFEPADLNPLRSQCQVAKFLHEYLASRSTFRGTMVLVPKDGARIAAVSLVTDQGLFSAVPALPGRPGNVPPF